MKESAAIKIFVCLGLFSLCLFSYLEKQNQLTQLRLDAPKIVKEIKALNEENTRLRYEIEQFESPENLLRLVGDVRFSHLKYPLSKDVVCLAVAPSANGDEILQGQQVSVKPKLTLAVGAK
jgi:hypothetical protein